ncbi:MAG: hypothetical protein QG635_1105, partial [Bacteroidota bacterium]|nr:hypothetical protein [Bacteroidota bacterium]
MEKFYKVLVISMLIQLASFFVSYSGENNPQINGIGDSGLLLNNSSLGTDFWISIPKNSPLWGWTEGYININITSIANTRVMIYDAEFGKTTTKDVEAYQMVTLSTKTGELNMNSEITDGEQVLNKALRITADDPIIVQVINYTANSSYGYTAIPVSQWGNEYYHSGYYDYNYSWYSYSVKNAGGFIIIASENSTKITVELKGIGKGMAKTTGGNDIGNILKATLNEGDVYMVRGDGLTKGLYDLTGSRITSTLPVGVISFHNGTTIPSFYTWGYGSDALAEMMMPVQAWGTKFATVQYDRSPTMGAESQGEFFRVIGSAANTHVSCQYFDVTDG